MRDSSPSRLFRTAARRLSVLAADCVRRLPNLVLMVCAGVSVFAAGELVYRLQAAAKRAEMLAARDGAVLVTRPTSAPLIYELKPGIPGLTNGAGFRDRERSLDKPVGVCRVAVVGDSVTMQGGLPLEDLYFRHLQRLFDRDMPRWVEVLSFGVTGYNAEQEAALLERRVLAYEPDLVVWQLHDNDGAPTYYRAGLTRFHYRPNSYFASFLGEKLDHLRRERFLERRRLTHLTYEQRDLAWNWDALTATLDRVAEMLRHRGIELLVFLYPSWPRANDWRNYGEGGFELHRRLVAHLESSRTEVVDLLPVFAAHDPGRYRVSLEDPWHPNASGQELIAETIYPGARDLVAEVCPEPRGRIGTERR